MTRHGSFVAAVAAVVICTQVVFAVEEEAGSRRSLQATCSRDPVTGAIFCGSSVFGSGPTPPASNPSFPPANPSFPPSNPSFPSFPNFPATNPSTPSFPSFPNSPANNPPAQPQTVVIRGCTAKVPSPGPAQDVARAVLNDLLTDPACTFLAPNFIRIAFHDSGTFSPKSSGQFNGANGSIRNELNEPANLSGLVADSIGVLHEVVNLLAANGVFVSFADIVQLSAAEAAFAAGGPFYTIPMGRQDFSGTDVYDTFAGRFDSIAVLLDKFFDMGLDIRDFVALSGAHTLGSQATGNPNTFDNQHFVNIRDNPVPLESDKAMLDDPRTKSWVDWFATNQDDFFSAYATAMIKVSTMGAVFSQ